MTKLIIFDKNRLALDGPVKKGQLASRSDLGGRSRKLVAIDTRLEDYQKLAGGVEFGTDVLLLDPQRDAVGQIARALSDRPADSLQIACHGAPGLLYMGKTPLTGDNLSQYSYILSELAVKDIHLYACNVAEDKNFIQKLHQLTGANIAASAQKIGNAAKGGTWELENRVGKVTTTNAFLPEVRQSYSGVLISFAVDTENTLTSRPFNISIADFNSDGRPDLAVTVDGDDQVAILLGNEDGTFADPVPYDTGDGPAYIAAADLDGDGDVDLAISNYASNNVSVLLGEGDGTFGAATNIDVGTAPYGIVAADFDGDGSLDLAVGNDGGETQGDTDTVSLLLGNGDGTFGEATNFDVGDAPSDIVTDDFDGDGSPDIATSNDLSNDVSVLLGDGEGGFADATSFAVGDGDNRPYDITTGDFDGDGVPDLAVSNNGSSTVSVLLGDGDGGFGDPTEFDVADEPFELVVADLDGDGNEDIATSSSSSNVISVLSGNGDGTFAEATNIEGVTAPWAVAVEDIDADGFQDLVVGSQEDATVSVLLNTTDEEPDSEPTDGDDNLLGTPEGDRINGLDGNDTIRGAAGNDILSGDDGDDRVAGNKGNDRLFGKDGNDVLLGRQGNDRLFGGDGNDTLEGGIGRDRINGGAGSDQLTGGASKDLFIFNTNEAFDTEDVGVDTITDFDVARDLILLDKTTFAALESDAGSQAFSDDGVKGFSIDTEFEVVDTEDAVATSDAFIIYETENGGLYYNGDGEAVQFATLTDAPTLEADNFFLR
ncbi:MAG: FG-GAP-like repeat-containing protein [Cyanobacteriota bacterium]|nr:FG-GAP-like repeat-containing protein [Cyanobacteriota bacterium]